MGFMDLFEDPFDTFVNMLLHFALFYTACSSTSHLNLLHIMPLHILDTCSLFSLLSLKLGLTSSRSAFLLTDHG